MMPKAAKRASATCFVYPGFALVALLVSCPACSRCTKERPEPARLKRTTPGATIATVPAHAAYVTNNGSDTVSVIDRDAAEPTVQSVPVDVDPDAHEAPHHLAVDARTRSLFVALAFPPAPTKTRDPHGAHGRADAPGAVARLELTTLAA